MYYIEAQVCIMPCADEISQFCYVEGHKDYFMFLTFPVLSQLTSAFLQLFFINHLAKNIQKDAN